MWVEGCLFQRGEQLLSSYTAEENEKHRTVHGFAHHRHPAPVLSSVRSSLGVCAADTSTSLYIHVLVGSVNLALPGRREPRVRNCPHQVGLWAYLWGICLLDDCCGRARRILGSATAEQAMLRGIRKQAEGATEGEPVSSIPPWFLPLLLAVRP